MKDDREEWIVKLTVTDEFRERLMRIALQETSEAEVADMISEIEQIDEYTDPVLEVFYCGLCGEGAAYGCAGACDRGS